MSNRDRLYVYDNDKELIEEIKKTDFLGIKSASNTELFLIFVSIGHEKYIEYSPSKKDGYIHLHYITPEEWTYLYSICIQKFGDASILDDEEKMFDYIQKCAHFGIKYLHKQLKEVDTNRLKIDIIKDLQSKMEQINE